MNKESLIELQNTLTLVSNLQDRIKENTVSMVDISDQLDIIKQRLDAILRREPF